MQDEQDFFIPNLVHLVNLINHVQTTVGFRMGLFTFAIRMDYTINKGTLVPLLEELGWQING